MNNIEGVFHVEFSGKRRTLKVTIGLAERMERQIFKRPLIRVLKEALSGEPFVTDVYAFFHEALIEGGDSRYTFEQVGKEILKIGGAAAVLPLYSEMLSYALTGGIVSESGGEADKKK